MHLDLEFLDLNVILSTSLESVLVYWEKYWNYAKLFVAIFPLCLSSLCLPSRPTARLPRRRRRRPKRQRWRPAEHLLLWQPMRRDPGLHRSNLISSLATWVSSMPQQPQIGRLPPKTFTLPTPFWFNIIHGFSMIVMNRDVTENIYGGQ